MVSEIDLDSIKPMVNGKEANTELKTHFDPVRRKLQILTDSE
jgi:hypothetical protein